MNESDHYWTVEDNKEAALNALRKLLGAIPHTCSYSNIDGCVTSALEWIAEAKAVKEWAKGNAERQSNIKQIKALAAPAALRAMLDLKPSHSAEDEADRLVTATSTLEWKDSVPLFFRDLMVLLYNTDNKSAWIGEGQYDGTRWRISSGSHDRILRDDERVLAWADPVIPDIAPFLEVQ